MYVRSHQIKSKFFHLHAHIILYDKIGYFIKQTAMLSGRARAHRAPSNTLSIWFLVLLFHLSLYRIFHATRCSPIEFRLSSFRFVRMEERQNVRSFRVTMA